MCSSDVAEQVVGFDEVVARVQVAGVLDRELQPAGLRVDADAARLPVPVRERGVEHLDVHLPDVAPDPLLEHVDHEPPVLLGSDRAFGDEVPFLLVERTALHAVAPPGVRDREVLLGGPLDDRDELDERRAELVAEEPVHLAAVIAVPAWIVVRTFQSTSWRWSTSSPP